MGKGHQFTEEQYAEVMELLKRTTEAKLRRKLEILQLRMEGYKDEEIAGITKYSKSRVSALVCVYAHEGISYFEQENRVGGHRRNISFDEESKLLAGFDEKAEKGQLITVQDIKAAYEKEIGHKTGGETIYRVLKRHGWRKVLPRSKHPKKASDEAIDASKKLTSASEN